MWKNKQRDNSNNNNKTKDQQRVEIIQKLLDTVLYITTDHIMCNNYNIAFTEL